MGVVATVKLLENNFDEWLSFFKIYERLRNGFATNEVAYKYTQTRSGVFLKIIDIDCLNAVYSSQFLLDGEAQLGVNVEWAKS